MLTTQIDLIYEATCPNVDLARRNLRDACLRTGIPANWREWDIDDVPTPEAFRSYGSPTILVDCIDVAGGQENTGAQCCRLYLNQGQIERAPSVEAIAHALSRSATTQHGGLAATVRQAGFQSCPIIGLALLPKLTCAFCWPAYASILGSLGVGFVNYTSYLLPLTAVLCVAVIASLAYRARNRNGYGPCFVGIFGVLAMLTGKHLVDLPPMTYVGIFMLVIAALWNAWPSTRSRPSTQYLQETSYGQTTQN